MARFQANTNHAVCVNCSSCLQTAVQNCNHMGELHEYTCDKVFMDLQELQKAPILFFKIIPLIVAGKIVEWGNR